MKISEKICLQPFPTWVRALPGQQTLTYDASPADNLTDVSGIFVNVEDQRALLTSHVTRRYFDVVWSSMKRADWAGAILTRVESSPTLPRHLMESLLKCLCFNAIWELVTEENTLVEKLYPLSSDLNPFKWFLIVKSFDVEPFKRTEELIHPNRQTSN